MSIWVLTRSHNEYDQYGDYFDGAWDHKPTIEELNKAGVEMDEIGWVWNGGGRQNDFVDVWYNLFEVKSE
jgi:hypothetical protein